MNRARAAWLIAIVIGFLVGVPLGYVVTSSGAGAEGTVGWHYWVSHPLQYGVIWWGLFGSLIATGVMSIRRLIG